MNRRHRVVRASNRQFDFTAAYIFIFQAKMTPVRDSKRRLDDGDGPKIRSSPAPISGFFGGEIPDHATPIIFNGQQHRTDIHAHGHVINPWPIQKIGEVNARFPVLS